MGGIAVGSFGSQIGSFECHFKASAVNTIISAVWMLWKERQKEEKEKIKLNAAAMY